MEAGINVVFPEGQGSGSNLALELAHGGALGRLVPKLEERELSCQLWKKFDKAFACAWLNNQQVVVGTKCNHLLLINTEPWRSPSLPSMQDIALPIRPDRPSHDNPSRDSQNYLARPSSIQSALWTVGSQSRSQASNSVGSAVEDEGNLVASMIESAESGDNNPQNLSQELNRRVQNQPQAYNCGMHCISVSPCGTLLASGGSNPNDCQIFSITDSGSLCKLEPLQTLIGHGDWLFGCDWVTDRHIVTGSRDTCLKLWGIGLNDGATVTEPLCTRSERKEKVRDIKYLRNQERVASLSIDGTVQFWDPHLNLISTVTSPYGGEVVCMAVSNSLATIGSRNHVAFVDYRQKQTVHCIANVDHNHGIRSLAFSHQLLSVGGGQGKIHFWDLRKSTYMEGESGLDGLAFHLKTGPGFLLENEAYWNHFEGMAVNNACYAHAWNPGQRKLLTVGGPLAYGLNGHYAAIWE